MNIEKSKIVVRKALNTRITPFLWGPHGISKSSVIMQLGEEMADEKKLTFTTSPEEFDSKHFGFVDLRLGQMEIGDLLGMPIIDEKERETHWCRPKWFPKSKESYGILFLDEINRGRLDVIQAVFQLVLDRRISSHVLPDGWGIVCAANPSGSEYYVNDLDPALMDRFIHIKYQPEVKEWVAWAKNGEFVSPVIVSYIEKYHAALGLDGGDVPIKVTPSPRSWHLLSKMLDGLDNSLWMETAMGIIGTDAAVPFIEHIKKNIDKPVYGEEILNEYPKHKKHIKALSTANEEGNTRIDMIKISCDDLERILKKDYATGEKTISLSMEKNLVDFIKDIPKDLSFSFIKTIVNEKIMGTRMFNTMICKYDDLFNMLTEISYGKKE